MFERAGGGSLKKAHEVKHFEAFVSEEYEAGSANERGHEDKRFADERAKPWQRRYVPPRETFSLTGMR